MDYIEALGMKARDEITDITGKISGVYFGFCEVPQYKIEFQDMDGCANNIWIAVDRAVVLGITEDEDEDFSDEEDEAEENVPEAEDEQE